MSDNLLRCLAIMSFIEEKNRIDEKPSKESIEKFVKSNFYQDDDSKYGKSTFHRDIEFIQLNFNESLASTKTRPALYYFETYGTTSNFFNDLNRSLVLLSALKEQNKAVIEKKIGKSKLNKLTSYIVFDEKESTGIDYFKQILDACENHQIVGFDYFSYKKQKTERKTIQPYLLKEKKSKWYVLGFDLANPKELRSYALERISNFENKKQKFEAKNIDFETEYKDAFGMFTNGKAEKVVLQFDFLDGNYLKSNPIHHSQKIKNVENGVEIELFIKPTVDLVMELMSRSLSLKIVKPEWLKDEIKTIWKNAVERNS